MSRLYTRGAVFLVGLLVSLAAAGQLCRTGADRRMVGVSAAAVRHNRALDEAGGEYLMGEASMDDSAVTPSADALVTPLAATQRGFLVQAVRKTNEANPYIRDAKALHAAAERAGDVHELLQNEAIRDQLVAAVGFSEKATGHFAEETLEQALHTVLHDIGLQAGEDWRDEVVYRYLLTRGDSLGGVMRNVVGNMARERLTEVISTALMDRQIRPGVRHTESGKIQAISWAGRRLLFDRRASVVRNNVDIILLDCTDPRRPDRQLLGDPTAYVACGELKGGIDPAGADEHWKTARTALDRIRERFPGGPPPLFFIGAAIEPAMAQEIVERLEDGRLQRAANLTNDAQLRDIVSWLVSL